MAEIVLITNKKDIKSIVVREFLSVEEVIKKLNQSTRQIAIVANKKNRLIGTITDGDIRRGLLRKGLSLSSSIKSIINLKPLTFSSKDKNFQKIQRLMTSQEVHSAPLVDSKKQVKGFFTIREQLTNKFDNTVLIMAGGRGLRLMPITKSIPKPMVKIAGKPVLESIITKAKHEGFTNITISINYLGSIIEKYFGNGKKFGVNISYIKETKPLGTAGSIKYLSNRSRLPFIVMNGDVVSEVNLSDLINFHKKEKSFSTVVTHSYYLKHPYGVISTKGFKITKFEEKPSFQANINAGVYAFNHQAIKKVKFKKNLNMIEFLSTLKKNHTVNAYPIHEDWYDIGTHEQLQKINKIKK